MGVQIEISGIHVNFPFEPYDVQRTYMEKVFRCLQKGENGLLESPTGTGKTLCLLCATLAWLEVRKAQHQANVALQKNQLGSDQANLCHDLAAATGVQWFEQGQQLGGFALIPKIIYSSRTHSQLSQVVQELKRSDYRHVKAVVVGSRDQLCLNPDVVKETNSSAKIHLCRAKVNARTCSFYNNVEAITSNKSSKRAAVVDIEDLVKTGTQQNCCPYYLSRSLKQEADIIFMPYNYLLDTKARKAHGIELEGNVVIFDEAHNVEKICEDSVSVELRSQDLAACISEVTQLMQLVVYKDQHSTAMDDMSGGQALDFTLDELCIMKTLFCELEDKLDTIKLPSEGGVTFPGNYIFQLLAMVELTHQKKDLILEFLDKLILFLSNGNPNSTLRRGGALQKFADMVRIVFSQFKPGQQLESNLTSSYKVHISREDPKTKQKNDLWTVAKTLKQPRTLNYWCFNPGIGMLNMIQERVRCLILTSGTLAPLNTFASELQIPFPVRLENPHIIDKRQVWVGVVTKGPDGTLLNSSFKNRSNASYVSSLGNTIVNFARIVPSGLLVFFPSYSVMAACQKAWEDCNLWRSIANIKTIFVENQAKRDFKQLVDEFYKENGQKGSRGAIFMAVCRGKVSEGLDFADHNGRAVIVTGLPFPPWKDPKVTLKMSYLDEHARQKKLSLIGQEWYRLESSRAVNQAIGRVIRHKDDYGAIILCDSRFGEQGFQSQLSSWLKPQIVSYPSFGPAFKSVSEFFKGIQGRVVKPTVSIPLHRSEMDFAVSAATSLQAVCGPLAKSSVSTMSAGGSTMRTHSGDSEWSDHYSHYAMPTGTTHLDSFSKSRPADNSVFCAMDSYEQRVNTTVKTLKKHSSNEASRYENLSFVASKKKKLNVLPPGTKSNPIAPSSSNTDEIPPVAEPSTKESKAGYTKDLLKTVKLLLPDDKFLYFKFAIKDYSQDNDIERFAGTLISICADQRLHGCLRDLRKFVLATQREKYDAYLTSNGVSPTRPSK